MKVFDCNWVDEKWMGHHLINVLIKTIMNHDWIIPQWPYMGLWCRAQIMWVLVIENVYLSWQSIV